jgi:hypothetical protein
MDVTEALERLRGVAEWIDDRSFDLLREAVAEGQTRRPDADKVLQQARRAIDKAIRSLESLEE